MLIRVILSHVRNRLGSPLLKICAGIYWPFLEKKHALIRSWLPINNYYGNNRTNDKELIHEVSYMFSALFFMPDLQFLKWYMAADAQD